MKTALFKPLWEPFTLLPVTENAGVNVQTALAVRAVVMLDPGEMEIELLPNDISQITSVKMDGLPVEYTITGTTLTLPLNLAATGASSTVLTADNSVLTTDDQSTVTQTALVEIDRDAEVNYSIFVGTCVPGINVDSLGRLRGIVGNIASITPKEYKFSIRAEWDDYTADIIKTWTANPEDNFLSWNFDTLPDATADGALVNGRNFYTLGILKRGQYVEVGIDMINPDGTPIEFAMRNSVDVILGETTFDGLPLNLEMSNDPLMFTGLVPAEAIPGDYFVELYTTEPNAPAPLLVHFRVLANAFFELTPLYRLRWDSESYLGEIHEAMPSSLFVSATNESGETVSYAIAPGSRSLPPGLSLASNGEIRGLGPALDADSTITFSVKATSGSLVIEKEFSFDLIDTFVRRDYMTVKLPLSGPTRRAWQNYATQLDAAVRFRASDPHFPVANPNVLLVRGLTSRDIPDLEYDEPFWTILGPFKVAQVKDAGGTVLYDVIYREFIDPMARAGGFALGDTAIEVPEFYPQDGNIKLADASIRNLRYDLVAKVGLNSEAAKVKKLGVNGGEVLDPWMTSPQDDGQPLGYVAAGVVGYVPANMGTEIAEDLTYGSLGVGKVVHFDRLRVEDGTTTYFYYMGVDHDATTIVPGDILPPINMRVNGIAIGNLRGSQHAPIITWEAQQDFVLYTVGIYGYDGTLLREVTDLAVTSLNYTNVMWTADGNPSAVTIKVTATFESRASVPLEGSFAMRAGWDYAWGYVYGGEPLGTGLKVGALAAAVTVAADFVAAHVQPPNGEIEAPIEIVPAITAVYVPMGTIAAEIEVESVATSVVGHDGPISSTIEVVAALAANFATNIGPISAPILVVPTLSGNYTKPQRIGTIGAVIDVITNVDGTVTFPNDTGAIVTTVEITPALAGTVDYPDGVGAINAPVEVSMASVGIFTISGTAINTIDVVAAMEGEHDGVMTGTIAAPIVFGADFNGGVPRYATISAPIIVGADLNGNVPTIPVGVLNAPVLVTNAMAGTVPLAGYVATNITITPAFVGATANYSGSVASAIEVVGDLAGNVPLIPGGVISAPVIITPALSGGEGYPLTSADDVSVTVDSDGFTADAGNVDGLVATEIEVMGVLEGAV